jgi:uncharacterized protein (TIGR00251 family)
MPTFHDAKSGAAISVKVTPRAKKTEVIGVMEDGTIRVRVAAVPEEGKANQALIEFLARVLDIPASAIDIMGGLTSERKLISLIGITPAEVERVMMDLARAGKPKAKAAGAPSDTRGAKAKKKAGKKQN